MALSADAKTMADFLAALTHPDTNAIRQAEAALKPLLKRPECVPVLIEVIKAREVLVRFFVCLSCCYSGQYCWGALAYDMNTAIIECTTYSCFGSNLTIISPLFNVSSTTERSHPPRSHHRPPQTHNHPPQILRCPHQSSSQSRTPLHPLH